MVKKGGVRFRNQPCRKFPLSCNESRWLPAGEFFEQGFIQADSRSEIFDRKIFVGRVRAAVGKRKPEQQCFHAEDLTESIYDRNAASLPDECQRLSRKSGFQGALGGLSIGRMRIRPIRITAVAVFYFQSDTLQDNVLGDAHGLSRGCPPGAAPERVGRSVLQRLRAG